MTKESASESIFKPALVLMSGRALGFVATFVIPIVLVRLFDQTQFGTYKQLFLIFTTLFGIAQVGMAESLFYFLPSAGKRGGRYAMNSLLTLGAAGLLCLAVLWAGRSLVGEWLNNQALASHVPLIGVYLLLMLMAVLFEIIMTARKRHFQASCVYALSDLSRAVLYILPVLFIDRIEWLLYGAVAFALIRFTAALVYLHREYRGELRPDSHLMRQQLRYAVPFGAAVVIEVLQMNLHMYAVSAHFDTATFAIYAVGVLQIPIFDFMMTSTTNVMMVKMREKLNSGDNAAVLDIWRDTTRKLALVFFPLVGALLVVANELIVFLFTEDYARSVPIFMVWSISVLLMSILTDAALRVYAQTRFLIFVNVVRLVIIASLVLWFMQTFGLMGAVLVTLLATLTAKFMSLVRVKALLRCSLAQLMPWGALAVNAAITAAAAAPALSVKAALDLPALPLMIVTGFVFSGVFFLLLFAFGPLSRDEKSEILWWAQRPLVRAYRCLRA